MSDRQQLLFSKNVSTNIKALGMIGVMLGHLVQTTRTTLPGDFANFSSVFVNCFLFISGYGLTKSYQAGGLDGFFKKRFSTVYIPFFLATFLSGLLTDYVWFREHWLWDLTTTVLFINPQLPMDTSAWFVYFITFWYIIFYIVHKIKEKANLNDNVKKWIPFAIFFTIGILLTEFFFVGWVIAIFFRIHSLIFPLGVLFATINCPSKLVQRIITLVMIIIFTPAFFYYVDINWYKALIIINISSGIGFPLLVANFDYKFRILEFTGNISYELYLFENHVLRRYWSNVNISDCFMAYFYTFSVATLFKPFHEYIKELLMIRIPDLISNLNKRYKDRGYQKLETIKISKDEVEKEEGKTIELSERGSVYRNYNE
ncbi:hypothetical protein DLAC_09062 [Tieghemostelium lacteum]|uniref:Acyltransferase 3 domain-containing protein n=1 Tax=Tieghemostelium lacteum TaxID=361077 RepID=A0A151Z917_TIELA|nr:hypothetical protein DLAC_09062 [Tieghemostelium lacteum]|eukprot:KYQ90439.1 hypothetical protein DLAC_09062 [Tieghemostelium lacteum]